VREYTFYECNLTQTTWTKNPTTMHITMTVSDNNLKSFIAAYIHLSTRVALHHMKRDKNPLKEKPNTERPIQPNT